MSVSSGSDVTIPIQDSPPPPPSPYGNRKLSSDKGADRVSTPEPRGDIVTISGGLENGGFQAEASCLNSENSTQKNGTKNKCHTEIPMSDYSNGAAETSSKAGSPLNEAVNSELVNMNVLDTIPHKPQSEFGPYENFDDYFISVNQHKKFLRRGEKLYVTKDKRKSTKWRKYICWFFGAFLLAAIVTVAVLAAVGLIPQKAGAGSFSMVGMTTTTGFPETSEDYSSSSSTLSSATDESPSTTSAGSDVPVPDIYVPWAAELQLVLENGEYELELGNSSSTQFQTLASEIEQEVKSLLEAEENVGRAYASVSSFSSGSIIAMLKIGWTESGEPKPFLEIQRLVSGWKQIGNYQLRQGTTTIYRMLHPCKSNNGGCSDICTFEYEKLDIDCTCPESKVLGEDKKTCQIPLPLTSTTESPIEPEVHVSPDPTEASPPAASSESSAEETPVVSSAAPEIQAEPTSTTTATTSTTTTTTTTTSTTTTTTEAPPEPSPADTSSSHESGRSLEPAETTVMPEVEPELGSTDLPRTPMEDYNSDPIQVYPDVEQPLQGSSSTTTTTTEKPAEAEVRPIETASQETVPLPIESHVESEAETPVETTISPMEVLEIEMSSTKATTTTSPTTAVPAIIPEQESGSYEDGSYINNSQSLESETIVAATTTPATTTTTPSTTTPSTTTPAPASGSEEQIDSHSTETVSEEAIQPVTNLTSQSRKTGRAETSAFVDTPMEQETEAPATGRPLLIPTRPQSTSDEFMAFSDANMKEINARLTNKTTTSTVAPESGPVEAGSYENISGAGESEVSSGSHSEEGGASMEERRTGALLQSPPEVIPMNSITTTTTTPASPIFESIESSRERETMETVDVVDPAGASQEREVTTIQPISLHNDTAVNNLTQGITEDPVNTESVIPSKEDVVFDEVQHPVPAIPETTVNPVNSVEVQAESAESLAPISSEISAEQTTTTSTTTTTPVPIEIIPTSAHPTVFSTTLKILPNLGSNSTTGSAEPSQTNGSSNGSESSEQVNPNPSQTLTADNEI